jgi:hypothetical protein
MTTIPGVDPSAQAWQQDTSRPPAKDFAHELAKRDEQAKTNLQNEARSNQEPGFENLPMENGKPGSTALPTTPTAMLSVEEALALQSQAEQLAKATVTPIGVTEALLGARVFGWHAMAQAYLSELTAADGATHPHDAVEESLAPSMSAPDEEAKSVTSAPVTLAATETDAATPQLQGAVQDQPRSVADDASVSNTAELTLADTTASSYWSERSLRFTRQRDGGSVAWLRDFRVSDAEASHLIQWVLDDAKAKGTALSKIMLNGREAWASPNFD